MAKRGAKTGKRRAPVAAIHAASKPFVLGRAAFKKISAVEGILVSQALDADLAELATATGHRRRSMLAAKYGKR